MGLLICCPLADQEGAFLAYLYLARRRPTMATPPRHSSWPAVLQPSAACSNATTFVTLLTGARYSSAATCLPQMLRDVGTICPLLLVYNDADASLPLARLEAAYGTDKMLPLSRLKARYSRARSHAHRQPPTANGHAIEGRRLFSSSEAFNTHLKLWLWALPTPHRVVFLDVDILILRSNVSSLLDVAPPVQRDGSPGLGAVTCKSKYGERYFNSGILVFTPSLRTLERLLELARFATGPWNGHMPHPGEKWPDICSPRDDPFAAKRLFPNATNALSACRAHYGPGRTPAKMAKACESKLTDQSILNTAFPSHVSLPRGYNHISSSLSDDSSVIVHFVGEPKPWSPSPFSGRSSSPFRWNATALWRQRCASALQVTGGGGLNTTAVVGVVAVT